VGIRQAAEALETCEGITFSRNEPLAPYTTYRIGGPADLMVCADTYTGLTRALRICEVDGRVVSRAATTVSPMTSDMPIYVGKRNFYGASDTVLAMVGRLYGFRLFRNGTYARDLQPVRSGGVGYVWDSVTNTLLANAGTGSFAIGPDVN
jgi:hypothetical protein